MIEFSKWDDLNKVGIDILTGEACAYSGRLLCDLSEEGVRFFQDFMNVTPTNPPWNTRGVASIMLPRLAFDVIAVHAVFFKGFSLAVVIGDGLVLGFHSQEDWDKMKGMYSYTLKDKEIRTFRLPGLAMGPRVGTRMVHAMSGRID